MPECKICGSLKGTALHYGGLACGSCKVFFLRAITNKVQYVCEKDGKCPIVWDSKSKCRSCRFIRCLRASMRPEAVGTLRDIREQDRQRARSPVLPEIVETVSSAKPFRLQTNSEEEKKKEESKKAVVPYFNRDVMRKSENLKTTYNLGISFVEKLRNAGGAIEFALGLTALEANCDNDFLCSTSTGTKFNHNLEISLAAALSNPLACSERTPMGWRGTRTICASMVDTMRALYCRTSVHYLDWLGGCPEMYELSEKDKLSLISAQMCNVQLLTMIYNTYKTKSDGILFCNGYQYITAKNQKNVDSKDVDMFLDHLAHYMHEHVISTFRRLNITPEEYALLKMITLYTTSAILTDEGQVVVRKARLKYEQVLISYMNEMHKNMSEDEKSLRVHEIVALIKHLLNLSYLDNIFCGRMVTLNLANMRGQLAYDFHLKKF